MRVLFEIRTGHEGDLDYLRSLVPGVAIAENRPSQSPDGDFEVFIGSRLRGELLDRYRSLKYAIVPFAGILPNDREVMLARPHLTLLNSHFNAPYVAEHAWGLLLAVVKRLVVADRELRRNNWSIRYAEPSSTILRGGACGIVGAGAIGKEIAALARAFGMRVSGIKRTPDAEFGGPAELPKLLRESDAVFLCVPSTPETRGMLGARELALMKPGAALVNIARAEVVDEEALFTALREKRIGAGLDVWYSYPPSVDARANHPPSRFPFHELDNVVLSPHRSAMAIEGDRARMEDLARMLLAIRDGRRPDNVVDVARGY
jgi:phosphoglycerate dehydrogenase-like enzyme